ncbi:MAG: hypothetical protein ACKOQ6_06190, partial [Bacteroidota bacterium]
MNYQTAPLNEIMGMNQLAGDVELLRSKIMSHRVISKMPMAVSYFSRGNVLDNENYLGSPYTIEYVLLDSAIIGTKFELEFQENGAFTIEYPFKGQEIISDGKVNSWLTTSAIRLKVIVRDINQILQQQNRIKKNSYYFIINNPEDIVDEYSSKLLVTILNQSAQTVRIQVQDNNPYKASDFANTVMDEYNRYDRERKSEGSERSIDFINETILAIDSQLRASEVSLESFKKQNMVINPTENATDVLAHMNTLVDQRVLFQLDLAVLDKLKKTIAENQKLENLLPLLAGTQADEVIKVLVQDVQDLETRRANLRFMATEENAAIRSLDIEITNKKKALYSALENARQAILEK